MLAEGGKRKEVKDAPPPLPAAALSIHGLGDVTA